MPYRMLALMTGAQVGGAIVQQGLGSLSPALVETYHLSDAALGASFSALGVGSAAFTILAGILVDRFGERPVVLWGGVGLGLALFAAAAIPWYPWFVVWIFVFGCMYAAQTPAGGRAVLAWFDRDRGFAMSIRQAGVPLGGAIGGVLLPAITVHADYRWSLVFGGIVGAGAAIAAAIFYRDAPRLPSAQKPMHHLVRDMLRIARQPQTILFTLACMVLVSGQTIMNAFFAVTAVTQAHASIALAASAFAFAQVCAVVGRIVWGRLSDGLFRGNRALPLVSIALILALDAFAIAHISGPPGLMLFVLGGSLGFSAAGWNGVFATAMAEIGGADLAGSILGLGLTFIFGASAVAPLVFGGLADRHGLSTAWNALGVLAIVGLIPPLLAMRTSGGGRLSHGA